MRRWGWAALLLLVGCYNSTWGSKKSLQAQSAQRAAPAALHDDTTVEQSHASTQKLRMRALVTPAYAAQVVDSPRSLRELMEDTNRVTERDLGFHVDLVETRSWQPANESDIDQVLEAARAEDAGEGVDWVVGFVGSLPRASRSFHEVGKGQLVGKHIVVRAPSSAERHDAIEQQYGLLDEEDRRNLEKRLRRHRATATFLHELGHTLGSVHEQAHESIMYPVYNTKMEAFGPAANDIMRAALASHDASEKDELKAVIAAYEKAPDGAFFPPEIESALQNYRARSGERRIVPPPPPVALTPITDGLTVADSERFRSAHKSFQEGDASGAWTLAKPLFKAYPKSLSVQDLRCQLATKTMPFNDAKKECVELMKLSTQ